MFCLKENPVSSPQNRWRHDRKINLRLADGFFSPFQITLYTVVSLVKSCFSVPEVVFGTLWITYKLQSFPLTISYLTYYSLPLVSSIFISSELFLKRTAYLDGLTVRLPNQLATILHNTK